MASAVDRYTRSLIFLLPEGSAWATHPGSNLRKLLDGLAAELCNVDDRADDALNESDPRTVFELLDEWEAAYGLPGPCLVKPGTLDGRRAAILAKVRRSADQSVAALEAYADALGFEVQVVEPRPFECGRSSCGDALYSGAWVYVVIVQAPTASPIFFRAGQSGAGSRLVSWDNNLLECSVNQWLPAHLQGVYQFVLTWSGYAPWPIILPPPVDLTIDAPSPLVTIAGQILL